MLFSYLSFPLVVSLLFMSAFFSSSESAFYSLDELKLKKIKHKKTKKLIKNLLSKGSLLLIAILIGNTIVNILISATLEKILPLHNEILTTLIITGIILLFGETLPKIIAIFFPDKISSIFSYPLYFIIKISSPILTIIDKTILKLMKLIKRKNKKSEEEYNKDIIFALESIVSREEIFDSEEKDLIENVLSFARREVWNIMTPRNKIISIDKNDPPEEILKILKTQKFSKIPVYEGTNDNIIGYIDLKDFLIYYENQKENFKIDNILKQMYFVPETKKLSDMLLDFEKKQLKIATVIDEYGSALGIVTLSDVLGEILGEIIDESFKIENKIIKITEEKYLVYGDISFQDFIDFFEIETEGGDFETLAGFVIDKAEDIPDEGFSVKLNNLTITVKKKNHTHIEQFIVEKN
ncbi:MAG: hemolysin family protein [Brevinematales bacterium]|nr:hemolysin family protein [Brevinematales bacterium]